MTRIAPLSSRPNILLCIIDALRPDALGCYGGKAQTPNLDRLAGDGILFERAYSVINSTDASLTSIMTGLSPSHHGIVHHGQHIQTDELAQVASIRTLAEILRTHDYTTFAVDWLGRWHRRGFDHYTIGAMRSLRQELIPRLPGARAGLRLYDQLQKLSRCSAPGHTFPTASRKFKDARILVDTALNLVERLPSGKPFFSLLHFWDCHMPYHLPPDAGLIPRISDDDRPLGPLLDEIGNPAWQGFLRQATFGCATVSDVIDQYYYLATYVDRQIGRLVEGLAQCGHLENTLLVVTSDHGESLTEHGILFDHHGLYDPSLRVPWLWYAPRWLPRRRTVPGFAQHLDLVPTLLEWLEIRVETEFDGYSLLPQMLRDAPGGQRTMVFAEESHTERRFALYHGRYKYLCYASDQEMTCRYCVRQHSPFEELYDLECDPGEMSNVVRERPEIGDQMAEAIRQWREGNRTPELALVPPANSGEDNAEIERRLRDLGYL